VLLAAAVAQPLPPLLAREITGAMYISVVLRSLVGWGAVLVATYLFVRFLVAPGQGAAISEWLRDRLPVRGYLDTLRARRYAFALETTLGAGLAAPEALELAAGTIVHPAARARAEAAARLARQGRPFHEALAAAGVLGRRADRELARITGATGDPAVMLARRRTGLDQDAERECEIVAEWLPRVFYLAAVTWFVL
jgi:type II secretory pathway component PulF